MKIQRVAFGESRHTLTLALLAAASMAVPSIADARTVIPVPDINALYREVNNAANQGALLLLTSTTPYRLEKRDVNGGRLELQKDMGLQGMGSMTIIDASGLDAGAYGSGLSFKSGAVRLGNGANSLANLTVRNATAGPSAITTDLPGTTAVVTLTNVVASNSQRGFDIRNLKTPGRALNVTIATSYFIDNQANVGQGLRVANIGSDRATIRVTLSASHFYGNIAGCLAANLDSSNASIAISSSADSFDGNSNGCVFIAGLQQEAVAPVNVTGNSIAVDAYASRFSDNTEALPEVFPKPGGIIAVGGQNSVPGYFASNNRLSVNLYATPMGNNQGSDVTAYGAYSTTGAPAGSYNAVVVRLIGTIAHNLPAVPSDPPDGTNTATVQ